MQNFIFIFALKIRILFSRLQNVTPVSYSEVPLKKAEFKENGRVVIEEGAKPEVYTEEHEKLLGNTDKIRNELKVSDSNTYWLKNEERTKNERRTVKNGGKSS